MKEGSFIPNSSNLHSNLFGLVVSSLCLIALVSFHETPLTRASHVIPQKKVKSIEVQWAIKPAVEPEKESKRFVEANPNSPLNPPDKTNNFSFRDQQAAQPTISKQKKTGEMPETKGVEFSSKISPTARESPASKRLKPVTPQKQNPNKSNQKKEQSPPKTPPEEFKDKPLSDEGLAVRGSEKDGVNKIIDLSKKNKLKDQKKKIDEGENTVSPSQEINTIATRPRPKLSPDLLRGPIMKTVSSAPRMGVLAIECRLHPYGVYVQEMLRSIEDQWHHLAHGSLHFLQKDKLKSKITYRFTLKADGTIQGLLLTSNEKTSLPAELCRQAIASRVPYGEWTQQMIDDFGQTDEITIHFNYR